MCWRPSRRGPRPPPAKPRRPPPTRRPHPRLQPPVRRPNLDMKQRVLLLCVLMPWWQAMAAVPADLAGDLEATPSAVTLTNLARPQSVLLRGRTPGGYDVDLTGDATFRSSDDHVARV